MTLLVITTKTKFRTIGPTPRVSSCRMLCSRANGNCSRSYMGDQAAERQSLSPQSEANGVDGAERASSGGFDDGANVGVELGPPFAAKAVGDLTIDGARTQRALRAVVGCALPRCAILPGGNPGRRTLAPAGSTRGGSGGDE